VQASFFPGASLQRCGPRRPLACSGATEFAGVDMHRFSMFQSDTVNIGVFVDYSDYTSPLWLLKYPLSCWP
jgi:hypothetical protein